MLYADFYGGRVHAGVLLGGNSPLSTPEHIFQLARIVEAKARANP
jgi:hypothetical protein